MHMALRSYIPVQNLAALGVPGQFDGSYSDKVHMTGRLQNKSYQTHHYHHTVDTSGREDDMNEQLIVTNLKYLASLMLYKNELC